jgi:hypothetical protein
MAFLEQFRRKMLEKEVCRISESGKRSPKLCPMKQARSIGILYEVGDEQEYIRITRFVSELQSTKKEVRTLGYISGKIIPHYCYPKLAYDYISKKNINWYYKPYGDKFRDFAKQDFDLLLNLDMKNNLSLHYAAAMSQASMKAGAYDDIFKCVYDFMVYTAQISGTEELTVEIIKNIELIAAK